MKTLTGTLNILLLTALLSSVVSQEARAQIGKEAGTCADVKIQLSQSVAITRTAFQAKLVIGNSPVNVPLQNLKITLDIRDLSSNPANAVFGISNPVLSGISDVAGTGTISPGAQGTAVWTILPTRDAAPLATTVYTVGGTISYTQAGVNVSLPLFPAPITVKPDPLLQFHYFLQRQVYSDDPFTPEVEPSEPFPLGLLVVNKGAGAAHNMTITSSQPKIVDNQKGLQIAFQLLGASVNGMAVSPSLTASFGDIAPGATSVADFLLLASLQGRFISFNATFTHTDDLNNPRTSILDSVDTHFLEHVVRIVDPADDGKPDFLALSVDPLLTDLSPLPDTVWNSVDGATAPVAALDSASDDATPLPPFLADGPVTNLNLTVHFVVPNVPAGFVYIRADDPGKNVYQLVSVTRSDGKMLVPGDNAWSTHRIIRLKNQSPYPQDRVYLFDYNAAGAATLGYTLTYAPLNPIKPTVVLTSPVNGATFSPNAAITVSASAASIQAIVKELDFYADGTFLASALAAPFTASYQPAVGTHTLKVVAIDANGTVSDPAQAVITVNPLVNKPPVITLTGPQTTDLNAPATVTLSAAASDPDGSIAKVDFYSNGTFLGSSIAPPYVTTLQSLDTGSYNLTAIATDNQGATTTSNSLFLQVEPKLTNTGLAILRIVSAVRQSTPGQILVTVQNSGGADAVGIALATARIRWGGQSKPTVSPATVPLLAPNSTTTYMLQFPAADASKQMTVFGTYSGRSFSAFAPVTP